MSWAARRRLIIVSLIAAVVFVVVAITLYFSLHKAPSCSDNIQNQNEQGIDCGGPCPYLCTALLQPPVVLSTRVISNGTGRTDVLAYVENENTNAAAKAVPYTIALYGADHTLVQQVSGTVDLPPAASVPVFAPGVASGNQKAASAFLSIDATAITWFNYHEQRTLATYSNDAVLTNAATAPRITATLANASAQSLSNIRAVVVVRDAGGTIIAASSTIVPLISGQGRAQALFTWNAPFTGTAASIEVIPLVALP